MLVNKKKTAYKNKEPIKNYFIVFIFGFWAFGDLRVI